MAPLLRRRPTRRREPEGHGRPRAALLRAGDPAARAPGRAHSGLRPREFAPRPRDGARASLAHGNSQARARDRGADPLSAERRFHRRRNRGPRRMKPAALIVLLTALSFATPALAVERPPQFVA